MLETARGGILRRGLGYDRADVAVITNISADHLGDDGIDELDELVSVKALIAEEIRRAAAGAQRRRPAGRPHRRAARGCANAPGGQVLQPRRTQPRLVAHRRAAASPTRSATASSSRPRRRGARNHGTGRAARLVRRPGARGRQRARGHAACRALGVTVKDIRRALHLRPAEANPGRGNVYQIPGTRCWSTTATTPPRSPPGTPAPRGLGRQPVAAITLPGDRRDDLVAETRGDRDLVQPGGRLRGQRPARPAAR